MATLNYPRALEAKLSEFTVVKTITQRFGTISLAHKKFELYDGYYSFESVKKENLANKNLVQQVLGEVDCSFIVQHFYTFYSKDRVVWCKEYMNGGDLKSLLCTYGFFEESVAVQYVAEIAAALLYLHEHGVKHKDVRPHNVLVGFDGHIKLRDFGLSERGVAQVLGPYRSTIKGEDESEDTSNLQMSTNSDEGFESSSHLKITSSDSVNPCMSTSNDTANIPSQSSCKGTPEIETIEISDDESDKNPIEYRTRFNKRKLSDRSRPVSPIQAPKKRSSSFVASEFKDYLKDYTKIKKYERYSPVFYDPVIMDLSCLEDRKDISPEYAEFHFRKLVGRDMFYPYQTSDFLKSKVSTSTESTILDYHSPNSLLSSKYKPEDDWWSLGICFYEFVTGVLPFHDTDPNVIIDNILHKGIEWPKKEEAVSRNIRKAVEALLHKNPICRVSGMELMKLKAFEFTDMKNLKKFPGPFLPSDS